MRIYLVRFAKIHRKSKEERPSQKDLEEVGKIQAKRTAMFFKDKNIFKLYIDNTSAGKETADIIKKELKKDLIEKMISPKEKNEGFERVKTIFKKVKKDQKEVIIVSSSDFITSFILSTLGLSFEEKKYFGVKNCSISTIELDSSGEVIDFNINGYSHLIKFSPYFEKNGKNRKHQRF